MPQGKPTNKDVAETVVRIAKMVSKEVKSTLQRPRRRTFVHGTIKRTAALSGFGVQTVSKILRHYDEFGTVPEPSTHRRRESFAGVKPHMREDLRECIQSFICNNETATVAKVHEKMMNWQSEKAENQSPEEDKIARQIDDLVRSITEEDSDSTTVPSSSDATPSRRWPISRTSTYRLIQQTGFVFERRNKKHYLCQRPDVAAESGD